MSIRVINWPATVAAVQAALDGTEFGPLAQSTLSLGVTYRNAVTSAGQTYDVQSNDGISNTGAYAASVQGWAVTAKPAWVELDRVDRAAFKLSSPVTAFALASFGVAGPPTWTPNTVFFALDQNGAVTPKTANGFLFVCTTSGTTGGSEPGWNATVGATTNDGGVVWTCVAPISVAAGGQPLALPWDVTLATQTTLTYRTDSAFQQSELNLGFQSLITSTNAIWTSALASKPAANPGLDLLSNNANAALNAAILNANVWLAAAAVR